MYNEGKQMPKIRYGVSYWVDRLPRSRQPAYPRHRGRLETDVAIVGGGMAGCATAYALARDGARVALIEASRVGQGAIGSSTALVMQEPDVDVQPLAAALGLRAARAAWQMTRRAALDLSATLRRLKIPCQLEAQDSIYFTTDPDMVKPLRGECDARRKAGLQVRWLTAEQMRRETNVRAEGAIRMVGNTQIDPFRACLGLAAAAVKRGAQVFERSPVDRIKVGHSTVELRTAGGTVEADQVVIATGHPGPLFKPLARHFNSVDTYAIATPPLGAKIRAELGRRRTMLWDTASPYHYLRWMRDDRIIFGGADQPPPHRLRREKTLVQRTGQLMYELSVLYPVISGVQPDYAWTGPSVGTADGLPYVGPHRNYPRHLFALGFGGNGLAQGFLASRVLLRHYLGGALKGDCLLGFTR